MYKSLYEIQEDYARIIADLQECEGELTPEMEFALTINRDELENKAEAYALRILEFNGQSALLKVEIDRLQTRAKQFETTAERLKETIKAAMIQFNVDKIKTNKITLSFRKSEAVEVPETFADEVLQFVNIKAEIDHEKFENAIKEAYENDTELPKKPNEEMLQYFKLSATVDKTKIKASLKEGVSVGDVMLLSKQNLQIK
jgi:hypothetical protein